MSWNILMSGSAGGATAESDWLSRINAAGVVWFHDFRNDAEVDNFRWINGFGNDPTNSQGTQSSNVRRVTTDGPTGSCLEIIRNAGSTDPAGWWRPFSALTGSGNGRGSDDPGAGGTITAKSWNASNPNQNGNWTDGWYGHNDYHGTSIWDGTDFYIQMRVKFSSTRWTGGNTDYDGKLAYVAVTGHTPTQEILIQSKGNSIYDMYTAFGSPGPLEFLNDPQNFTDPTTASIQPGGPYASTCKYPNENGSNCWAYPSNEWVTVLIHVTPGHQTLNDWGTADNGLEVWVARYGATSYTKIWNKLDYQMYFTDTPFGWNAFQASAYFNGQPIPQQFSQRYTQIIFSKQTIACPQVYA